MNAAVPFGPGTVAIQLVGVFQSFPGPFHMASWAEATPETPFKTMTGIAMRAARLNAALAVTRRRDRFGSGSPNGREPFVRRHDRHRDKGVSAGQPHAKIFDVSSGRRKAWFAPLERYRSPTPPDLRPAIPRSSSGCRLVCASSSAGQSATFRIEIFSFCMSSATSHALAAQCF